MEYFAFQWHITEACDQRCKHCYIYALGSHAKFQAMALEDMVRVIENCQAFCRKAGRLPYFYLTGGEPILHPQFWQLAGLLKARGLPFAILGNPFHLTDDVCQKLRDHGCRKYQLSLDGLRETHDRIRRPGSYDETLDPDTIYDGCNCGNCHMTILSDGAVYACRRMESKVGNALTDDLYDLFTGPAYEAYRQYDQFEKCAKCELLQFCRGCPAVAAGYYGSPYAPDPQCWKEVL